MSCDIGVIGMGVMGQNLALNFASKGFTCGVFNRTVEKVDFLYLNRLIYAKKELMMKDVVQILKDIMMYFCVLFS